MGILFFLSVLLLALFFILKYIELKRGIRFFEGIRKQADKNILDGGTYLTHVLPKQAAYKCRGLITFALHTTTGLLIKGVRILEGKLHAAHAFLKGKKDVHEREAASQFLQDVSNHKDKINDERKRKKENSI